MSKGSSVSGSERVREGLTAAISGLRRGRPVADRLCRACVELLDVDGAALSIVNDGAITRALGSSGPVSSELIELQFTLGEGPCLEAVLTSAPVMIADLNGPAARLWPTFAREAWQEGVRSVFALPVVVAGFPMATLLLYRRRTGDFDAADFQGCFLAAELAAMPLLDVIAIDLNAAIDDDTTTAWDDMATLTRSEVYQAAGMVVAQLDVSPAEALVRLRSYAFAHSMTTSEVAYEILDRRLRLGDDDARTDGDNSREL